MLCLAKGEEQAKNTVQALEYHQMHVHTWRRISCQDETSSICRFWNTAYLPKHTVQHPRTMRNILYNDIRCLVQT